MTKAKYEARACKGHPGFYEIKGYPGYAANRKGEILNKKTGHITKGGDAGRYLRVSVYKDGAKDATLEYVHDLVCTAFRGPRPAGLKVLHGNNQRFDNREANLNWGTQSSNIEQTYKDGLRKPANQYTVSKESLSVTCESWDQLASAFADMVLVRPTVDNGPTVAGKKVDTRKQERSQSLLELFLNVDTSGVTLTEDQTTLFMEWLDQAAADYEKFNHWQSQTLISSKPTYFRIELAGYYGGLCSLSPSLDANKFVPTLIKQVNYLSEIVTRYKESYDEEMSAREQIHHIFSRAVDNHDSLKEIQDQIYSDLRDVDIFKHLDSVPYRKRMEAATKPYPWFGQVSRVLVNGRVASEIQVPKVKTSVAVKGTDLQELNRAYARLSDILKDLERNTSYQTFVVDPNAYPYKDAGKNAAFVQLYRVLSPNGVNFYAVNQFYIERAEALRSIVGIVRGLLYFSDTVLKR